MINVFVRITISVRIFSSLVGYYFRLVCAFYFSHIYVESMSVRWVLALEAETKAKQSKRNNVDVWMPRAISTQSRE